MQAPIPFDVSLSYRLIHNPILTEEMWYYIADG